MTLNLRRKEKSRGERLSLSFQLFRQNLTRQGFKNILCYFCVTATFLGPIVVKLLRLGQKIQS